MAQAVEIYLLDKQESEAGVGESEINSNREIDIFSLNEPDSSPGGLKYYKAALLISV